MTARPYHFFLHHSYVHTVGRKANTHTVMRCMQMQHKPATRVRSILMSDAAHAACPCKQTRTSALLHVALSLRLHLSLPPIPSAGLSVSLSLPPTLPTSQLYRVENTQDRHSQARHGAMHLHVPRAVQVCAGGSFPFSCRIMRPSWLPSWQPRALLGYGRAPPAPGYLAAAAPCAESGSS